MPSTESTLAKKLSPDEHLDQAERYANSLPAALASAGSRVSPTDVALMDVYLHAAEVHLKLREEMLKPRVTVDKPWDTVLIGHTPGGDLGPTKREQA